MRKGPVHTDPLYTSPIILLYNNLIYLAIKAIISNITPNGGNTAESKYNTTGTHQSEDTPDVELEVAKR